jgi:hypothetical protein
MYCRGDCDFYKYYEAVVVSVDETGNYNFRSQSDFDSYGAIYTNSFDPSDSSVNLLAYNDDGGGITQFSLTVVLQPQSTYILVVTTYTSHETGSFQIVASGPTSVRFVRALHPSTILRTSTTPVTTKATTVKINSKCLMYSVVVIL